jgi:hypothetical protein
MFNWTNIYCKAILDISFYTSGAIMILGISLLAVLICVLSSWLLGGLWYSNFAFGPIYAKETGGMKSERKHMSVVFITAFILWGITAAAFAYCIGPYAPLGFAVMIGLFTGLFFVSTSFGVNYAFSGKSYKIFLIDSGYHVLQFVLYGVIFGLWNQSSAVTATVIQNLG